VSPSRAEIPARRLLWQTACRIIPSRYPAISLFDRVTNPADLEAVLALEAKTNARIRDEVGDLTLVPVHERISGPNSSVIMASFTHLNPEGSRFSDGSYGVFYASRVRRTAIAETMHHSSLFMLATKQPSIELDMRLYHVRVAGELHDLRGLQKPFTAEYSLSSYVASQALGRRLRMQHSTGICWDSVRQSSGECVAVFRPKALSNCIAVAHLCYVWNGSTFAGHYQKQGYREDVGLE
jgi:hypothetical protein